MEWGKWELNHRLLLLLQLLICFISSPLPLLVSSFVANAEIRVSGNHAR
jgi:hypothetical protein